MPRLPVIKPKKLVELLENFGFIQTRQKGSHLILKNKKKIRVTVPMHNKEIPKGTLNAILKDAKIDREDLLKK